MRTLLGALLLAFSALQASAGAWPRETGSTFVSLSQTVSTGRETLLTPSRSLDRLTSVFAEYGLTPELTFGLDASRSRGGETTVSTLLGFARRPLWRNDAGQIVSVELGLGVLREETEMLARLRPGLSWGRGFESGWGAGWMGIDSSVELRLPSNQVVLKADGTVGIKPTERWMLIMQVQTGKYPGTAAIVRLAPSVVRRLGPASHVQLGLTAGVSGDDAVGLKLGTWFTF